MREQGHRPRQLLGRREPPTGVPRAPLSARPLQRAAVIRQQEGHGPEVVDGGGPRPGAGPWAAGARSSADSARRIRWKPQVAAVWVAGEPSQTVESRHGGETWRAHAWMTGGKPSGRPGGA